MTFPTNGDPSTSASLLQRARDMESSAWDHLCALYGPLVYSWCRRAGLQESDTADATQEVFRSVYQHLARFRDDKEGDTFRGWLWTITTNQIRLHFRQIRARALAPGGSDAHQVLAQVPDPDLPGDEPDAESARLRLLRRALDLIKRDFSEATWDIFQRTTLQHEPDQEVAADLGMSSNAVRQARFRVLRRLRQHLDGLL